MNKLAALLFAFAPLAYAGDVVLPPAKPLSAPAEQLAQIPNLKPGPYSVLTSKAVDWELGDTELRVRVVQPVGKPGEQFPLVIFSHGFASDVDQYDNLLKHWASHGYLSIAPYHRDGGGLPRAIWSSTRYGNAGLVQQRVNDIAWLLAHVDDLDSLEPGLSAKVDHNRLVVAGHSFGAFSAQMFGGAQTVDPDDGSRVVAKLDPRVKAVVAVSPPGNMFGLINAKSWLTMVKPMLSTTGTWDADGRFVNVWTEKRMSFENAPAGQSWLLVVDGADHYLGNLICRLDRKNPPQNDALTMVNASAVTFMNAFVKQDAAARAYLDARPLEKLTNGFARLEYR